MSDPDAATTAHLEAIDAATAVWDHLDSFAFGSKPRERLARMALEAAAPLIEAEARAAERQRIRQPLEDLIRQLGDEPREPGDPRPSDRRIINPLRRRLEAIVADLLDGA